MNKETMIDVIKNGEFEMVEFKSSLDQEECGDYPLEALREIVINMIVHRDTMSSSDSIIRIFDDRIEFFNPGRLSACPLIVIQKRQVPFR
jgi:ATP-dependent DNA helicase RecG